MPPVTLTPKEAALLIPALDRVGQDPRIAEDILPKLRRAATPRNANAAGKRFERRVANELREIVAYLPGEWKVSRNQTDRQKGQVADGAGEFHLEGPQPFPWSFELKDGSGFVLEHLLTEPVPNPLASTPKREGFWAQAARQARVVGRFPILIVREAGDHHREFAVLRPEHRAMLVELSAVRVTLIVDGVRLDVVPWPALRAAPAARWLVPPPPPGAA